MNRRGAALTLALIILAALLLLGLPFLVNQNASVAGTRSYAHRQLARAGVEAGEAAGVAAGVIAIAPHLKGEGTEAFSTIPQTLADIFGPGVVQRLDENRFALDFAAGDLARLDLAMQPRPRDIPLLGVIIEDESAKLDVNTLSTAGWDALLKAVGIPDWDDDATQDTEDSVNHITGAGGANPDDDDPDTYGELARMLAELPAFLPTGRLSRLEQLAFGARPGYVGNGCHNGLDRGSGFRMPLTTAEIERLRPYLTVWSPAQGRNGEIDLGTVVIHEDLVGTNQRNLFLDGNVHGQIGLGTRLINRNQAARGGGGADVGTVYLTAKDNGQLFRARGTRSLRNFAARDDALAILAPAAVNIHHLTLPVRAVMREIAALGDQEIRTYAQLRGISGKDGIHAFDLLHPLSQGMETANGPDPTVAVELPPLDIHSSGVVTVETAAIMTDAAQRQTAQASRRRVVQAVRQERVSERRWLTQGQHQANRDQRATSNLASGPHPVDRLQQDEGVAASWPDDGDGGQAKQAELGPATQENYATGYRKQFSRANRQNRPQALAKPTHVQIDFQLNFGGAGSPVDPNRLLTTANGAAPTVGSAQLDKLKPDGYLLDGPLGYAAAAILGSGGGPNNVHFAGRHLSLWVKPGDSSDDRKDDWTADKTKDGLICLAEIRTPSADLPAQWNGEPTTSDQFNNLGLYYDAGRQLLVLAWAPPVIPWTRDSDARIPWDDPKTAAIDERSQGSDGIGIVGPLAPKYGDETRQQTLTKLFAANRIVTVYKVPDRNGRPYFRAGQWFHIQAALSAPRPGEVALIVDGIVGRGALSMASPALDQMGDHATLPTLPLATALPTGDLAGNASLLSPIQVQTRQISGLGLSAADMFPARGVLKIDDEYISYESVAGDAFAGCVRAARQDANPGDVEVQSRWPRIQEHAVGTAVMPGGYRILPEKAGTILAGGAAAPDGLGSGDPSPGLDPANPSPRQWSIWAAVDAKQKPVETDPDRLNGYALDLTKANRAIPLAAKGATTGVADQFPDGPGIAVIRGATRRPHPSGNGYIYGVGLPDMHFFFIKAGSQLTNLAAISTWRCEPAASPPWSTDADWAIYYFTEASPPEVTLLSIRADGADIFDPQRYKLTDNQLFDYHEEDVYSASDSNGDGVADRFVFPLQLRDTSTGRVEWISYTNAVEGNGHRFFVNRQGWSRSSRGRERTDWAGKPGTLLSETTAFPAGATALDPVQSELGKYGHWLETGDVVTIIPKAGVGSDDLANGILGKPRQYVVRYAPTEGWDATGSPVGTRSHWATFLPEPGKSELVRIADLSRYEILHGPGWGGVDLSHHESARGRRGTWPRHDLWKGSTCYLFGGDAASGGPGRIDMMIDGIAAGPQWGANAALDDAQVGVTGEINALGSNLNVVGSPWDRNRPPGNERTALVLIDGEAMAVQTQDGELVGRGLLDFDAALAQHPDAKGPPGSNNLAPAAPMCILPIGPVRALSTGNPQSRDWFRFTDGVTRRGGQTTTNYRDIDAPVVLFLDPSGAPGQGEVMAVVGPDSNRYATAPWLRGLYATPQGSWSTQSLAIGWWPRYAPCLPTPSACTAQHFRSRTYAWAGFPLHLHNASFDPGLLEGIDIATVQVTSTTIDEIFRLEARALADGGDWTVSPVAQLAPGKNGSGLNACFSTGQFQNTVTAGAELRVTWHYGRDASADLRDMADAMNRTPPRIGEVRLRCLAPVKVLHTEEAR